MVDPLLLPSIAMLTGGGLLLRDYMKRRLEGAEDRYMALYARKEWDASNMDLGIHVDRAHHDALVGHLRARLHGYLGTEAAALLEEEADLSADPVVFRRGAVSVDDLFAPRRGLWFDTTSPDQVRVVWNHMQTDGVGMWNALRPLFDPNPPLIPYAKIPPPPPVLPELLALPSVARRLAWRGKLRKGAPDGPLYRGLVRWDAGLVRTTRDQVGGPFNLVTSALAAEQVLARHPDRSHINLGLTGYFPFLSGRNKYGVFLCKLRRAPLKGLVDQLVASTRHPVLNWGRSAAQAYALRRLPDRAFVRLVAYYRRQVDVLVSSLPVGQEPITLGGIPAVISCHPWELTLPYYFLLVGTRQELHVSFTSRYPQSAGFADIAPAPLALAR